MRTVPDAHWQGRRIAVTGGCGGIGRDLVVALAGAGAHVTVFDLPETLARHAPPDGVTARVCDCTDPPAVAAALAEIRALDGLVTLAGFTRARAPVGDTTLADWDDVIAGNLRATFLACRAALPALRAGTAPAIVTMASGLALKPTPGYAPYGAAKAGVLALTRVLAQENAPWLRVNAVAPGAVDTAFLRGGTASGGDDPDAPTRFDHAAYLRGVPLARLATPQDVTGPILFLLSQAAAYITGQTLHINGGSLMP